MTRFARAKGSKASNQRIPEEATPWSELKQKITKNTNDSECKESKDETNWKEVINQDKKLENNINSVWCDFSDSESKKISEQQLAKSKKKKKLNLEGRTLEGIKKSKKRKRDNERTLTILEGSKSMESLAFESEDLQGTNQINETTKNNEEQFGKNKDKDFVLDGSTEWDSKKPKKRKRDAERNKNMNSFAIESDFQERELDLPGNGSSKEDKANSKPHLKENVRFKGSSNWSVTGKEYKQSSFQSVPHKRRKIDHGDHKMDINGQEITVTRLDGFYIRKEDAERIRNLEKDLIKKGVPKEEIRAVVKKERRNAEKSLARQKKKVCFHCRKGGHNLSSCPKLSESMGSGICYKCGSTEHSHIECKVSTGYKFAVCFICKEEGHIARECPDNPRGLYPQGGGCKVCGDVTHLRRDCPQATKEKPTLDLIHDDLDTFDTNTVDTTPTHKRKNKIIKFK